MSELLSSITGGGGGGMIMPIFSNPVATGALSIRGTSGVSLSNSTSFYTDIEASHDFAFYDTATLVPSANQLEQTIIDTGAGAKGVLTAIISGRSAGTVTTRVYIDGEVTTFVAFPQSSSFAMLIGDFLNGTAQSVAENATSPASAFDKGFVIAEGSVNHVMLSPDTSASRGLPIGMVFEDSLKVTIQATSSNMVTGTATSKAVATWLTYIPEGVL